MKKHLVSPVDQNAIVHLYNVNRLSAHALAQTFGISDYLILRVLKDHQCEIRYANTPIHLPEDRILGLYASGLSAQKIGGMLGISKRPVLNFLHKHTAIRKVHNVDHPALWTEAEIGLLSQMFPAAPREQVRAALSRHPWSSILKKANRLGIKCLSCMPLEKRFPGIEQKILSAYANRIQAYKIADSMSVCRASVLRILRKHGVVRPSSDALRGKVQDPKVIAKRSESLISVNRRPEVKERRSFGMQQAWRNGKHGPHMKEVNHDELYHLYYVRKLSSAAIGPLYNVQASAVLRRMRELGIPTRPIGQASRIARQLSPNKIEKRVISVIEKSGLPFKYTGDWSFVIGGLNPDFVNTNCAKQLIEVFGRIWHDKRFMPYPMPHTAHESPRRAIFRKFGYDMLVLWDDELEKMTDEQIAQRIQAFSTGAS